VYGGTPSHFARIAHSLGLSPRVRGNPSEELSSLCYAGTIPACTGEPLSRNRAFVVTWDYPRVYGGTTPTGEIGFYWEGLSPRVRGNHLTIGAARRRKGTIPACTGESSWTQLGIERLWDYPRVYGGTWLIE